MNVAKIAACCAFVLALVCMLAWVDANNEKHADRVVNAFLNQCGADATDFASDGNEDGDGDVDNANKDDVNDRDGYADNLDDDNNTNDGDRGNGDGNDANEDNNQTDNDGVDVQDDQSNDADVDDGDSGDASSNNNPKALVEKISQNTNLSHGQSGFCPARDSRAAPGMGVALAGTNGLNSGYAYECGDSGCMEQVCI